MKGFRGSDYLLILTMSEHMSDPVSRDIGLAFLHLIASGENARRINPKAQRITVKILAGEGNVFISEAFPVS